jgi:hypothetical protein
MRDKDELLHGQPLVPPTGDAEPHDAAGTTSSRGPDPDPISELATIDGKSQDNDPDRPHLANQPGDKPGFGPDEFTAPLLEGNPELGIDPRDTLGAWHSGPKAPAEGNK